PMGGAGPEPVGSGEYCYVDGTGEVLCRLEFRQAEKTKLTGETRDCLFLVQGNRNTPRSQVESTLQRLIDQLLFYCGGQVEHRWIAGA
ncbi:MAG: hypothetical protein HY900_07095, partial [Deltaproteobacteria bacterium]|nr:hypothetical protein [Deltaproteobacteria bacterium]